MEREDRLIENSAEGEVHVMALHLFCMGLQPNSIPMWNRALAKNPTGFHPAGFSHSTSHCCGPGGHTLSFRTSEKEPSYNGFPLPIAFLLCFLNEGTPPPFFTVPPSLAMCPPSEIHVHSALPTNFHSSCGGGRRVKSTWRDLFVFPRLNTLSPTHRKLHCACPFI